MANTYTQIHIQAVFAVKYRLGIIQKNWKDELFKYVTGIIRENDHRLLAINGMPDHVHVFFGMRPAQSLSDLLQVIKANSSKWINERGFVKGRLEWQQGFGAFSYSKSQISDVISYIQNQETHHQKRTFLDEYRNLLEEFDVEYDSRYIFKELE
ncbi:MAG TPA: IS200/IS605 family transposase [Cyclobacteriaceae bacterium]|nr:IS200/IS605 family transposase [Cyclobacteriaceae bacterium]